MSTDPATVFSFVIFLLGAIALVVVLTLAKFTSLWFQALVSGTPIPFFNIVGMSLRKIPARIIVSAYINSCKAGLQDITIPALETHYLAGGNVPNVIAALIAANKANIPLDWKRATAIDLAGRDIVRAVHASVSPIVVDCPEKSQGYVVGVAKDGIQLKAQVRVTVRTNIEKLVGGATEETIIARVGQGIVSAIGAAENYKEVLEHPDTISKRVLIDGLDSGTAFNILSIDIVRLEVGENTGAGLKASEAEARKKVAQSDAEARRAMGVAMEQENASKLMAARAEIPAAIAEALRKGSLGALDYYRLENLQADTTMRTKLGKDK